jgi:sulfur carrier protein ThiS
MIRIHVRLYSILREKLPSGSNGQAVMQLDEGATLRNLLDALDITRKVVISVNGAHETDTARQLKNGDQVQIFSSISGGSRLLPLKGS